MAVLGNVGNLYVVLLLMFLVGGLAVTARNFASRIWQGTDKFVDKKGGKLMNKWLKIAIASFVGILIASFALGLTNNALAGPDSHQAHAGAGAGTGYFSVPGQPSGGAYNSAPVSYQETGDPARQMHQMQMDMMAQMWQMMQMQMNNMQMNNMQMNNMQMNGSGMPGGMSSGMGGMNSGMGGMSMGGQSSMNNSGGSGGMGMM